MQKRPNNHRYDNQSKEKRKDCNTTYKLEIQQCSHTGEFTNKPVYKFLHRLFPPHHEQKNCNKKTKHYETNNQGRKQSNAGSNESHITRKQKENLQDTLNHIGYEVYKKNKEVNYLLEKIYHRLSPLFHISIRCIFCTSTLTSR